MCQIVTLIFFLICVHFYDRGEPAVVTDEPVEFEK